MEKHIQAIALTGKELIIEGRNSNISNVFFGAVFLFPYDSSIATSNGSVIWSRAIRLREATEAFIPIGEGPYPSVSGSAKCCSGEGGSRVEHIRNVQSPGDPHDRFSSFVDRVPATLRRRGGLRAVSDRDALA